MKNTPKTLTLSAKAPRPAAAPLAVPKTTLSYFIDNAQANPEATVTTAPTVVTVVKKSRSRLAAVPPADAPAEAPVAEAALGGDRDVGERLREVRHAESLVAVVELGVLRQQRVGLVGRGRVERRRLADDVAETACWKKWRRKA